MAVDDGSPTRIRILTLNCWGLKYLSKFRRERMSEIGRQIAIADDPPQIVGLQECWTQEDYKSIRKQTKHILPYGKFYYSGVFGGGLAILSNGRLRRAACSHIRSMGVRRPSFVGIVFCTHLHAPYEQEPHDSYLCHRTAQAWEISKLMRRAAERGHLVIGLGDFNMVPMSFAHRLITAHAPVKDVWRHLHPDSSIGAANSAAEMKRGKPIPSADFNITENGAASDGPFNTWRWSKEQQKRLFKGEDTFIDGNQPDPDGRRLDYIFVGDESEKRQPEPENADDHGFAVHPSSQLHPTSAPSSALTVETYDEILEMVDAYELRERSQRRWRLAHFMLSILVSIGCFVGVWWTSDVMYVAFILMVVSTLSFAAGLLDGLIGGLFMSAELRALKEFKWEVRTARRLASIAAGNSPDALGDDDEDL
uniref:Inositol phosphosphingolipids phospholipase C n=1 Tax=Talaromyces marneffei PM1 TaxID=1077442 RepID=A0A093VI50_TALMA